MRNIICVAAALLSGVIAPDVEGQAASKPGQLVIHTGLSGEFISDRSFWIYVADADLNSKWKLAAYKGRRGEGTSRDIPTTVDLPAGQYRISMIREQPSVSMPLEALECSTLWSVASGGRTKVVFPDECSMSTSYQKMPGLVLYARRQEGFWEAIAKEAIFRQRECGDRAAPLIDARNQLLNSRSVQSVVSLPLYYEGKKTAYGELGNREFDARQIRLLVASLKKSCWESLEKGFPDRVKTPNEAEVDSQLKRLVTVELNKLDALKELAEMLEQAERRNKRDR